MTVKVPVTIILDGVDSKEEAIDTIEEILEDTLENYGGSYKIDESEIIIEVV